MGKGDSVMPPTSFTCSNSAQSVRSLDVLLGVAFTTITERHSGAVLDGREKLKAVRKTQSK